MIIDIENTNIKDNTNDFIITQIEPSYDYFNLQTKYSKKNKFSGILEINISNLAGVPSIIYGLLGLGIFVRFFGFGGSILSGSLTLSLLILPIIIVATREAIKAVPHSLKEASYALGASKWQTIKNGQT